MTKKIILFLTIFFSFIWLNYAIDRTEVNCTFPDDKKINENVKRCIDENKFPWVVAPWDSLDLSHWNSFSDSLKKWSEKIAILIGSLAVFMLVYASFLLVISWWEEEKIKKAKDIIKWTLLWFIWLISAWLIVMIIVKLWYFFWK